MAKPIKLTANDTYPTLLTFTTTDPETKITTPTDITGHTIALEIDYPEPLVKVATILNPPTNGLCQLEWAEGELIACPEGTKPEEGWAAKLTVTNAAGKKLSSGFLLLNIDRDITP